MLFDEIERMSLMSWCSGDNTAKVIPNNVSGLVVKTSKVKSVFSMLSENSEPSDLPIQFCCIAFTFSGQSPISSSPSKSSSE